MAHNASFWRNAAIIGGVHAVGALRPGSMEREREEACVDRCCLDGWERGRDQRRRSRARGYAAGDRRDNSDVTGFGGRSPGGGAQPAADQGRAGNVNAHAGAFGDLDPASDTGAERDAKINAQGDSKANSSADAESNAKEAGDEGFTNAATLGDTAG